MKRISNLEPLCALVMLQMPHAQLLRVLFADENGPVAEAAAQQDFEDEEEEDPPGCDDDSISLDFASLAGGLLPRAGVYRLSIHMRTCDTCKHVFASMVCEERRAKALDNFEDCCG